MEQSWTVGRILSWIEDYLSQHDDPNPRLSAQWLLSDVLACSRIELYTMLDRELVEAEREVLRSYTKRRGAGEPLQYITGTTDFRFLTLEVAPGVLIPRPETEVLVSEALAALDVAFPSEQEAPLPALSPAELASGELVQAEDGSWCVQLEGGQAYPVVIDDEGDVIYCPPEASPAPDELIALDICTGSGNIACSLASESARLKVYATDLSPEACALARRNVSALGLDERVVVLEGNLAEPLPREVFGTASLLISNPPYIPTAELAQLSAEVADYEAALALDGGDDGLAVFKPLVALAHEALRPGGFFACELHETCLDAARDYAQNVGLVDTRIVEDLAGAPRILLARTPF